MYAKGHKITGLNLGVGWTVAVAANYQVSLLLAVLAGICAYVGSNAPDRMEMRWWDKEAGQMKSVIPHRTITHWFAMWLVLGFYLLEEFHDAPQTGALFLLGASFCFGCLLHVVLDMPNKKPIPLFLPKPSFCLGWWGSSERQYTICFITTILMGVYIWWELREHWDYVLQNPKEVASALWQRFNHDLSLLAQR